MLKIIKVPDESTFTESDLKPGLRVIRKSDGAECVVTDDSETIKSSVCWFVLRGYVLLVPPGWEYAAPICDTEMLDWLNRDFRRVEPAVPQYKTVGEVPPMTVFEMEDYRGAYYRTLDYANSEWATAVRLNTGRVGEYSKDRPVTRVHGLLTIDPSVTEAV